MNSRLVQLQQRVLDLEALANAVSVLAETSLKPNVDVDEQLSFQGQSWYRGARELLAQEKYSGLREFENCYGAELATGLDGFFGIHQGPEWREQWYPDFQRRFRKARALILALQQEMLSRELPVLAQLSFAIAADEFDKAQMLLDESNGDEAILRAGGVVARVALERKLLTVADARKITLVLNPPHKRKADVSDVLNTLVKTNVITAVQRSHLDALFAIANNCAHPKETVRPEDITRLIKDGRAEAAIIV